MHLYLDGAEQPLPNWAAEMLSIGVESETPGRFVPARVGDFVVRFAAELSQSRGLWLTEVQPGTDSLLCRVAVVNCKSRPTSELAPRIAEPARNELAAAKRIHDEAAAAVEGDYPKLAVEGMEQVQEFWTDVAASLDALYEMGKLPRSIDPNRLDGLLSRLELTDVREKKEAASILRQLGELGEQWAAAMKGGDVGRN